MRPRAFRHSLTILIRIAVLGLSVAWIASPQEDPARLWREFVQWVKQSGNYENPDARYRSKLIAEGFSEKQADERIALLRRLAGEHREDAWTLHFNRLYSTQQTVFTTQPNAFLASVAGKLKPGKAIDVSMGEGRNAVFLATKGWQVTGFDIAEEGLKAARAAAAKAGVPLDVVYSRYEDFDFGREQWDLICFLYAFAPLSDASLVAKVRQALKPGGLVLIEHPMFEPNRAEKPHDRLNALPKAFGEGFRILFYEDTPGISDWQQGPVNRLEDQRRMVRFLARKYEP